MDYLIFGSIVAVGGAGFLYWLQRVIKEAVVQPARPDGTLMEPRLSKKKRITALKEQHGLKIGFFLGVGIVLLLQWVIPG
jgi:hypothetical protein